MFLVSSFFISLFNFSSYRKSISRMMPRCSHEGAASSAHGKHQPADVKHIDVGPFILDSLPQFISVGGSVRPSLDSILHLGPQILYRIHVWRLSRPGSKHVYVVSLKESSGCAGAMWRLLKVLCNLFRIFSHFYYASLLNKSESQNTDRKKHIRKDRLIDIYK